MHESYHIAISVIEKEKEVLILALQPLLHCSPNHSVVGVGSYVLDKTMC